MFTSTSTVFKYLLLCAGAAVLFSQVHSRTLARKAQEATLRMRRDNGRFRGVEENFSNRIRRDVLVNVGRWPTGSNLTYRVGRGPSRGVLKDADIDGIVKLALREWAPHCGLHFTKIHSGEANITIFFEGSPHLNCPVFNVPKLNAVGFSPFPKDTQNVTVCLDDDRDWTLFYKPGCVQFYAVLLHELGHTLGLPHSYAYSSVMYYKTHYHDFPDINLEPSTLGHEDKSRMRNHYDIADTNSVTIFDGTNDFKSWLFHFFTDDVTSRNKTKDELRRHLGFSNNTNEYYNKLFNNNINLTTNVTDKYSNWFLKEIYDIINE